jgi:DNA-binding transcriptional LysR family regulator
MTRKGPAIESRQLRYFVMVAEKLSFRGAAEALHMAQPALTRQIKALEALMKVRLFDRNSHHVAMTPAGQVALENAKDVLRRLDGIVDATRWAAAGQSHMVRVGFASHAAYHFVPELVRPFRLTFPQFGVELHRYLAGLQFDPLLDGSVDVAILRPLYSDPRIESHLIRRVRFLVALPAGHRLLQGPSVTMADLQDEDFVMPRRARGPCFQGQIIGFCLDAGFTPRSVVEAGDVQAMVGTVASGYGVTIIPETAASLHVTGVEYRAIAGLAQTADFVLAWRRNERNDTVTRFIELAARVNGEKRCVEPGQAAAMRVEHGDAGGRYAPGDTVVRQSGQRQRPRITP